MTKHAQIMKLLMELIMQAAEEKGHYDTDAMKILKELREEIQMIESEIAVLNYHERKNAEVKK